MNFKKMGGLLIALLVLGSLECKAQPGENLLALKGRMAGAYYMNVLAAEVIKQSKCGNLLSINPKLFDAKVIKFDISTHISGIDSKEIKGLLEDPDFQKAQKVMQDGFEKIASDKCVGIVSKFEGQFMDSKNNWDAVKNK